MHPKIAIYNIFTHKYPELTEDREQPASRRTRMRLGSLLLPIAYGYIQIQPYLPDGAATVDR